MRLHSLVLHGLRVPEAFCLSRDLANKYLTDTLTAPAKAALDRTFTKFVGTSPSGKLIVRSSSYYEGSSAGSFAGIFQTVADVDNLADFKEALSSVIDSADDPTVLKYAKSTKSRFDPRKFGIICQHQISASFSGHLIVGKNQAAAEIWPHAGYHENTQSISPFPITFYKNESEDFAFLPQHSNPPAWLHIDALRSIIYGLRRQFTFLQSLVTAEEVQLIEFALDNYNHIWFLQCTPLQSTMPSFVEGDSNDSTREKFHLDAERLGKKGAAARYFESLNLLNSGTIILQSDLHESEIRSLVHQKTTDNVPYTVRYSMGDSIGLPRIFSASQDEILQHINANIRDYDCALVHPFIGVEHSFELLIDREGWLLEHVPGNWETESTLPPDVLIFTKGAQQEKPPHVRIFRYSRDRNAKYPTSTGEEIYNKVSPLLADTLCGWAQKCEWTVNRIRQTGIPFCPCIVHFVEGSNGEWHFLNIRKGVTVSHSALEIKSRHVVNCDSDIDSWNGKDSLIVNATASRGNEDNLISLARRLPKDIPVFTDLGILSHPAIVLREFGVKLIPSYLLKSSDAPATDYEEVIFEMNNEVDLIDKILSEPAEIESKHLHFVRDAEPICDHHLLVLPKDVALSLADLPKFIRSEIELEADKYFGAGNWICYERGRSRFCSNTKTRSYAHMHLLPKHKFDCNVFAQMPHSDSAVTFSSIERALEHCAKSYGEYVLYGTQGKISVLAPSPLSKEMKRVGRHILQRSLRDA